MTRLTLLAAAAAVLVFPAVACAQTADPALDAFETVCAATGGDYVAVLKAADASGWTETQVIPETDASVSLTDQAAREKPMPGGETLTLLVNRGLRHTHSGDVPQSVCKVSDSKPDPGVIARSAAWLGFPQDGGDATLAVYYVKSNGAHPTHIASTALNAAMANGGFSIVKVQQDEGSAIFVYQTYSK
ncbi:MAG TPA: hypothetical protein VHW60_25010 [Caulobacteraceae bacterium]|jgi:hypothetical protein|nr:hypothetical protein [Caulobacteraceae bacterium]